MANEVLVTLTIQPYERAIILKKKLEEEGIVVVVDEVNQQQPLISSGVRLRIKEADLPKAMMLVEMNIIKGKRHSDRVVLIPVDFTERSEKACLLGFRCAHRLQASVVILHSYINTSFQASFPLSGRLHKNISEKYKEEELQAMSEMEQFSQRLKDFISADLLEGVKYECRVEEGVPEEAILELAKILEPILIVMLTRGWMRKREDQIGSVTAEVMDSLRFPLLAIPEGLDLDDVPHNMVFCATLERSDLIPLDLIMSQFECHNVVLAHVESGNEPLVEQRMQALYEYCCHQYPSSKFLQKIYNIDDFFESFERNLQSQKIGLVVIPNKKRNIFARLFNPSIAHRFLFQTDIPLLVIPR